MRLALVGLLLAVIPATLATVPAMAHPGGGAATASVDDTKLARAGFGRSRGYGRSNPYGRSYRSPYANRYRRARNRGFFTRLMRWVAIGFFLNFLLGTTVGNIFGLMLLALIVAMVMRRRRRAYSY